MITVHHNREPVMNCYHHYREAPSGPVNREASSRHVILSEAKNLHR